MSVVKILLIVENFFVVLRAAAVRPVQVHRAPRLRQCYYKLPLVLTSILSLCWPEAINFGHFACVSSGLTPASSFSPIAILLAAHWKGGGKYLSSIRKTRLARLSTPKSPSQT